MHNVTHHLRFPQSQFANPDFTQPISEVVDEVIQNCPIDVRRPLYKVSPRAHRWGRIIWVRIPLQPGIRSPPLTRLASDFLVCRTSFCREAPPCSGTLVAVCRGTWRGRLTPGWRWARNWAEASSRWALQESIAKHLQLFYSLTQLHRVSSWNLLRPRLPVTSDCLFFSSAQTDRCAGHHSPHAEIRRVVWRIDVGFNCKYFDQCCCSISS